jgi:hypothetical protein
MKKHPTAAPALPVAQPNIPCWTSMKPKRNTTKTEDRARQRKMAAILAPLRAALTKRDRRAKDEIAHETQTANNGPHYDRPPYYK